MAGGLGGIGDISGLASALAGKISMGQALGLMGGSPVIKSGDTIINSLKAAKTLESGGTPPQVMQAVTKGLSGLLQNPMSGKGGGAKNASAQATESLKNTHPRTAIEAAMEQLDDTVGEVLDAAAEIVGLGADDAGLIAMIGYAGTVGSLGDEVPGLLLKPALADAEMDQVTAVIHDVTAQFYAGYILQGDAVSLIAEQTAILRGILDTSKALVELAKNQAVLLATIGAALSLLVGGSAEWREIMAKALLPDLRPYIDAYNLEFLREKWEAEGVIPQT